jgi:hypothetical protein
VPRRLVVDRGRHVRVAVQLVGVVVADVRVVGRQGGGRLLVGHHGDRAGVRVGVDGRGRGRRGAVARLRSGVLDLLVHSTRVRGLRPDR